MENDTRPFSARAFVALTIAISGLGLPITGLANHTEQLSPMTVTRHAWMSAHNVLGVVFLVFATWHVLLNRRALASHARRLVGGDRGWGSREALVAIVLVTALLLLFVSHAFLVG